MDLGGTPYTLRDLMATGIRQSLHGDLNWYEERQSLINQRSIPVGDGRPTWYLKALFEYDFGTIHSPLVVAHEESARSLTANTLSEIR